MEMTEGLLLGRGHTLGPSLSNERGHTPYRDLNSVGSCRAHYYEPLPRKDYFLFYFIFFSSTFVVVVCCLSFYLLCGRQMAQV